MEFSSVVYGSIELISHSILLSTVACTALFTYSGVTPYFLSLLHLALSMSIPLS